MSAEPPLLLVLDLTGTFAFALNGALTALRLARLDIVGVLALGIITAIGGGVLRDVLLGSLPPATFSDWRYLAAATGGGRVAFFAGRRLDRLTMPITVLDAAGLSLFAVTGASKALAFGLGPAQAVILGAVHRGGRRHGARRAHPADPLGAELGSLRRPRPGRRRDHRRREPARRLRRRDGDRRIRRLLRHSHARGAVRAQRACPAHPTR